MKNMILASIFAMGFSAFAQEGAEAPAAPMEKKVEVNKKEVKHEKKGGKHRKVEKTEHKESAE